MKQIEYTEKQKLVLEILAKVDEVFKPDRFTYSFEKDDYFYKIKKLKEIYGIKELYKTLREYIKEKSYGSYHRFIFDLNGTPVQVCGVYDFENTFNSKWLDKFYVIKDTQKSFGSNCENYQCNHYLELVRKDD